MSGNDEDDELKRLKRQIGGMEREIQQLMRALPQPGRPESSGQAMSSQMWKCRSCNSLLGLYDPDDDTLRIRYKDHVSYFRAGGADVAGMAQAALILGASLTISGEVIEQIMEAAAEFIDPGFVQVICRNCTAVNETHYAAKSAE